MKKKKVTFKLEEEKNEEKKEDEGGEKKRINRLRKPFLYCPGLASQEFFDIIITPAVHDVKVFIREENIQRCYDPSCHCMGLGFIGKCPVCYYFVHNCIWGCRIPITVPLREGDYGYTLAGHYVMIHGTDIVMETFSQKETKIELNKLKNPNKIKNGI